VVITGAVVGGSIVVVIVVFRFAVLIRCFSRLRLFSAPIPAFAVERNWIL
jgi:hypothetical protein